DRPAEQTQAKDKPCRIGRRPPLQTRDAAVEMANERKSSTQKAHEDGRKSEECWMMHVLSLAMSGTRSTRRSAPVPVYRQHTAIIERRSVRPRATRRSPVFHAPSRP